MYAVITENDISQWDDQTGVAYHFPSKYKNILLPGTKVIYYKGRFKKLPEGMKVDRLTDEPHYFGKATIGNLTKLGNKNEFIAEIRDYSGFKEPILAKLEDEYLEPIPESKKSNYWRDGVRLIDEATYKKILIADYAIDSANGIKDYETRYWEGNKQYTYTTVYERNPKLRKLALQFHGYACKACGRTFGQYYGDQFSSLIHVHHIKPISQRGFAAVDPKTDLVPVCPNCHWIIHSIKDKILTVEQVKELIRKNGIS